MRFHSEEVSGVLIIVKSACVKHESIGTRHDGSLVRCKVGVSHFRVWFSTFRLAQSTKNGARKPPMPLMFYLGRLHSDLGVRFSGIFDPFPELGERVVAWPFTFWDKNFPDSELHSESQSCSVISMEIVLGMFSDSLQVIFVNKTTRRT